jgi:aminoglycoside 6'-N-acetyltransferase
MTMLQGLAVTLRLATAEHTPELARIRATPEVRQWWRGDDMEAEVTSDLAEPGSTVFVVEHAGRVVGSVQYYAEDDKDYRHASIDIYLDPAVRGRGLGGDAVYTLARHLVDDHGHHRLTIDPAVENAAAIACYSKVGFRPVGVLRRYERSLDGSWHDNLLMDLLAEELGPARSTRQVLEPATGPQPDVS